MVGLFILLGFIETKLPNFFMLSMSIFFTFWSTSMESWNSNWTWCLKCQAQSSLPVELARKNSLRRKRKRCLWIPNFLPHNDHYLHSCRHTCGMNGNTQTTFCEDLQRATLHARTATNLACVFTVFLTPSSAMIIGLRRVWNMLFGLMERETWLIQCSSKVLQQLNSWSCFFKIHSPSSLWLKNSFHFEFCQT